MVLTSFSKVFFFFALSSFLILFLEHLYQQVFNSLTSLHFLKLCCFYQNFFYDFFKEPFLTDLWQKPDSSNKTLNGCNKPHHPSSKLLFLYFSLEFIRYHQTFQKDTPRKILMHFNQMSWMDESSFENKSKFSPMRMQSGWPLFWASKRTKQLKINLSCQWKLKRVLIKSSKDAINNQAPIVIEWPEILMASCEPQW